MTLSCLLQIELLLLPRQPRADRRGRIWNALWAQGIAWLQSEHPDPHQQRRDGTTDDPLCL